MCPSTRHTASSRSRSVGLVLLSWLTVGFAAIVTTGCEDDVQPARKRPASRALDQTGIVVSQDETARAPAAARPSTKRSGPIISERTTEIRNARAEGNTSDAKVVKPQIIAKDYISLQGNAYVSIVGRTSVLKIQHAMDLYHAQTDRYPKDYDEFMSEIIKANSIALPQLPSYQKYGYDEKEHKLVILEYRALKDQSPSQ